MSKSPSINDEDRRIEQIVAYLDGELSPVEASLVERQLAEDADLRQELQGMERAWSALDALPTTKVDDRFSQTTMELVVGEARQELLEKTLSLPIQRRKTLWSKLLLATAVAALGFLVVRLVRVNPNRVLIADLPAIQYIDAYSQFQEVDFIRRLNEQLSDEVWVADLSAEELADEVKEFQAVADPTQRRQWIDELDEQDRSALRGRYNRFVSLPPEEQARLRDLHAELLSAPDSEKLERTMLQYRAWLSALPASRQFELRNMPIIDRVNAVVAQQHHDANNRWIELSPEEKHGLERVMVSIRETIRREMSPQQDGGQNFRGRGPNPPQRIFRLFAEHREEWLPQILNALSDETRSKFEALAPIQQNEQLVQWILDTRRESGPRGNRRATFEVSQQELERFFVEEVDPEMMESLLAQPRDRMEQRLRRLYLQDEFGLGDFPPEGRPFGPPPRGERGGYGPRRGLGGPPDRRFEAPPDDRPDFPPPGEGRNFDRPRLPPPEEEF